MRSTKVLDGVANHYFQVAKQHRGEYAQMREGEWAQIPGFEGTTPDNRAERFADRVEELETAQLKLDPGHVPGGVTLKTPVRFETETVGKERGNFKYNLEQLGNQQRASQLLLAIDEPVVPIAHRHLEKGDKTFDGWLKANIPHDARPGLDPRQWTVDQRREALIQAVGSQLFGNYDTKADQWSAKGGHMIDSDLDHVKIEAQPKRELTRHTAARFPGTPPEVNLLYKAYVHGQVELTDTDFAAMFDFIARLQALPPEAIKAAFPGAEGDKLVARIGQIHLEMADHVEDLKGEKSARENGTLGLFTSAKLGVLDVVQTAQAGFATTGLYEKNNQVFRKLQELLNPPKPIQ